MSNAQELQDRGIQLFQQHVFEGAKAVFQQALEAYEKEDQQDMAAEMRVNIALIHRTMGEHEQSLELMQKALAIFSEMNDDKRSAQVLGNMGGVFAAQGDTEQAMACYRQAADTFHAIGEEKLYGETLIALADLQVRSGNIMAGAATYEVGLENIDDPSASQKLLKGLLGIKKRLTGS